MSSSSSTTIWVFRISAATAARSRRRISTASPAKGLRYTQFYNTARCSPSRASLLTGLHPHQTGIGILTYSTGPEGYAGNLNRSLRHDRGGSQGRQATRTYLSGKWHIAGNLTEPTDAWPLQRGFDSVLWHHHRGRQLLRSEHADPRQRQRRARGQGGPRPSSTPTPSATRPPSFIREHHRRGATPTSPSSSTSPIRPRTGRSTRTRADVAKYKGRFDAGWDRLRESSGWSGSSPPASFAPVLDADGPRPDPTALERGGATRLAAPAAWRSTPPRSTAWTRASAVSSQALEETGQARRTP